MLSFRLLSKGGGPPGGIQGSSDPESYYADGVDDYYASRGENAGWHGKGARALGLSGPVRRYDFHKLLNGFVANGEGRSHYIPPGTKERLALDLTFSAPKSVSLQALAGGDARIIAAHDRAVVQALNEAERLAGAIVRQNGQKRHENTANIIAARFRHETSRAGDPQLHTHAVVMNLTRDRNGKWRGMQTTDIVSALKTLGLVYQSSLARSLTEAGYRIRQNTDGTFELAHISRQQIEAFSRRSTEIDQTLARAGLDPESAGSASRQRAALASRRHKTETPRRQLYEDWTARARQAGVEFHQPGITLEPAAPETDRPSPAKEASPPRAFTRAAERAPLADEAVKWAMAHLSERDATFTRQTLEQTALARGIGTVSARDITIATDRRLGAGDLVAEAPRWTSVRHPEAGPLSRQQWEQQMAATAGLSPSQAAAAVAEGIRDSRLTLAPSRLTTRQGLAWERAILAIERQGRNSGAPVLPPAAVRQRAALSRLSPGQQEAVTLILTTGNRIAGIQGLAGSGKSTMLKEVVAAARSAGWTVEAMAPYASQVKTLRELDIRAQTIAAFLRGKAAPGDSSPAHSRDAGQRGTSQQDRGQQGNSPGSPGKTLLLVDEAGVIPARQLAGLLRRAEREGARVILTGDTGQTKAIEAGRPFEQLQAAGMSTVRMGDIRRQQNEALRQAVTLAADGHSSEALSRVEHVREISGSEERYRQIAADFLSLPAAGRETSLVIAGTNEARRQIARRIREGLGTAGKGEAVTLLVRRDTTRAQRSYAADYQAGEIIQPEHDYKRIGLQRGELYRVTAVLPDNRLVVRHIGGSEGTSCRSDGHQSDGYQDDRYRGSDEVALPLVFNPSLARKLSVYSEERTDLAPGDRVRITRNDSEQDLANGDRMTVQAAAAGQLVLVGEHGRQLILSTDRPLHLDHAWTSTIHSSQGLTCDHVLLDLDSTSRTTSRETLYVGISRARHQADIYTDSLSALPAAVARALEKTAALDIIARDPPSLQAGRQPRGGERE